MRVAAEPLRALREGTRPYHDALEEKLAPLLGTVSASAYTLLLRRLFGFYEPVERRMLQVPGLHALPIDMERRRKAPLLARDLLHLGMTRAKLGCLPECERLPGITNPTEALGCLYVMEGATLGGQIITRHLKRNLLLDEEAGCAFFYSYGKDVGQMWKSFQETLGSYCSHKETEEVLVESARETFISLHDWLFDEEVGDG